MLPIEAVPGRSTRCPACKKRLIFRACKGRKSHFVHPSRNPCPFRHSTTTLAQHVLYMTLTRWLHGKGDPVEVQPFCEPRKELPRDKISAIILNHPIRLCPPCSFTAHLSLLDRIGQAIFHIHIQEKSEKPRIDHPAWLEVSAEEILENPHLLSPLHPPSFKKPIQLELDLDS